MEAVLEMPEDLALQQDQRLREFIRKIFAKYLKLDEFTARSFWTNTYIKYIALKSDGSTKKYSQYRIFCEEWCTCATNNNILFWAIQNNQRGIVARYVERFGLFADEECAKLVFSKENICFL